jgi:hypothetical protein
MQRDELREHLIATLEAAPELEGESRRELADVFFRELDEHFTLVPRGEMAAMPQQRLANRPVRVPFVPPVWLLLLVPLLLALSLAAHAPVFLFAIILFVILRSVRRPGWRGGPPIYHL